MAVEFSVVALSVANERVLWPYIRNQLLRIEVRDDGHAVPETVMSEYQRNAANVWAFLWKGEFIGCAVTYPDTDEYRRTRLWCWALTFHGEGNNPATPEQKGAIVDWLRNKARSIGAATVGMSSSRKGWERYAESIGFHKTTTEFALPVN